MATTRLYYNDSYLQSFHAQALSISENGLRVVLDQTAFYPTSGGQPHDLGSLNGIPVLDVIDEEEHIIHVLAAPLSIGPAEGRIHWPRRFDHMQQHSGQHLLSAVAEESFGLVTRSVHFGELACTVDLEGPLPSSDWLAALERRANEQIVLNLPIHITFEEAANAPGLRKPSDRPGIIRVISIERLDRSACGGTHVRYTAEIASLLLGRTEKVRNCTRLEFRCGYRVIDEARRRGQRIEELEARLAETDKAARKSLLDLAALQGRELYRNATSDPRARRIWREEVADFDEEIRARVTAYTSAAADNGSALVVLTAPAKRSVLFAASANTGIHCGKLLQTRLVEVGGKGGGGPQMAQGNVPDVALLDTLVALLLNGSD